MIKNITYCILCKFRPLCFSDFSKLFTFITLIDNRYHVPIDIEYNVANMHLIIYNHNYITFSEVDSILIITVKFKQIPKGNLSL